MNSEEQTAVLVTDLFEKHHGEIFAYLYRLVDNREWANDLTQDTFLRLYQARERLAEVDNHRAWVYRIASNLAFNALKRRRRFQWLPWRQSDAQHLPTADPASDLARRDRIAEALAALPPHYRAPLLLYGRYDHTIQEIAHILNISPGAVKTRLHRARRQFRAAYEETES